jgi:hypothetical protein
MPLSKFDEKGYLKVDSHFYLHSTKAYPKLTKKEITQF